MKTPDQGKGSTRRPQQFSFGKSEQVDHYIGGLGKSKRIVQGSCRTGKTLHSNRAGMTLPAALEVLARIKEK